MLVKLLQGRSHLPHVLRLLITLCRYTQGLCFAKLRNGNPDSNHYGFPLPIIPVMDTYKKEIIRIDRLATGGVEDGLNYGTADKNVLGHCKPAEYVPELLETPLRKDVKPLNVLQPDGPSFTVSDDSLIEWQNWRFRVGFVPTSRENVLVADRMPTDLLLVSVPSFTTYTTTAAVSCTDSVCRK
jgi:Cu2+-containing amine oxidase